MYLSVSKASLVCSVCQKRTQNSLTVSVLFHDNTPRLTPQSLQSPRGGRRGGEDLLRSALSLLPLCLLYPVSHQACWRSHVWCACLFQTTLHGSRIHLHHLCVNTIPRGTASPRAFRWMSEFAWLMHLGEKVKVRFNYILESPICWDTFWSFQCDIWDKVVIKLFGKTS